jgi:hypothetical protein
MPLASGWAKPRCVGLEEEYILWKEKSGLMMGGQVDYHLGGSGRPPPEKVIDGNRRARKRIGGSLMAMQVGRQSIITIGELLAEIAEASQKIDANLKQIMERRDESVKPSPSYSERN